MYRHKKNPFNKQKKNRADDYNEEYSAEFMPSTRFTDDNLTESQTFTLWVGYTGLFLSLFSLFMLPVLLGIIGTAIGIYTVNKGIKTLGYTTIGFGLFSILVSVFYNLMFIVSAII